MKKNSRVFLEHILQCIELIESYTKGKNEKDFFDSVQLQDAVIRRLEIIGEAVRNLPTEIKRKYPEIPWQRIAGLRNIFIHEYFGIDLELTWQVVVRDMPELKSKIIKIEEESE